MHHAAPAIHARTKPADLTAGPAAYHSTSIVYIQIRRKWHAWVDGIPFIKRGPHYLDMRPFSLGLIIKDTI